MKGLWRALWWLPGLLGGAALAQGGAAPANANDSEALDVIEVVGERAGPGLWKVTRGERSLYLLGTFTPLPKRMTWRSRQVESVLDRAAQVIPYRPSVDADIGPIKAIKLYRQWRKLRLNPGGRTLDETLPAPLLARLQAARQRYGVRDDDILELRPLLAANEISRAAVASVGLRSGDSVADSVFKMAKRRDVPILRFKQRIEDPMATLKDLGNIDPAAEQQCLAATLARLDVEVATLREQVAAWAVGDVARLESQHAAEQRVACWSALTSAPRIQAITAEFDRQWMAAIVRALETNVVTLAVSPIGRLLQKDGVLAQLAARGYEVTPP